jgi:hypothetical protein
MAWYALYTWLDIFILSVQVSQWATLIYYGLETRMTRKLFTNTNIGIAFRNSNAIKPKEQI